MLWLNEGLQWNINRMLKEYLFLFPSHVTKTDAHWAKFFVFSIITYNYRNLLLKIKCFKLKPKLFLFSRVNMRTFRIVNFRRFLITSEENLIFILSITKMAFSTDLIIGSVVQISEETFWIRLWILRFETSCFHCK